MTQDDLEDALRAWGRCYGEGKGSEWQEDRSLTGNSPIAELAGRKPSEVRHGQRSGAAMRKLTGTPAWASEPIPARETRTPRPSYDRMETPVVIRVQSAWLALSRADAQAANVVRIHYQLRSLTRKERAERAGLAVETYKANLRVGKAWLAGCLSRAIAA